MEYYVAIEEIKRISNLQDNVWKLKFYLSHPLLYCQQLKHFYKFLCDI